MADNETEAFMLGIFILGVFLMVVSSLVDSDLDNCVLETGKDIRRANKGILIISVIFMSVSLNFLYQKANSCVCPKIGAMSIFNTKEVYITFFLILGIVLIGLSSTIKANDSQLCVLTKSSSVVNFTIIIGVIMTLGCGGYLGMSIYNNQRVGVIPKSSM
jgi:hypothetical protein